MCLGWKHIFIIMDKITYETLQQCSSAENISLETLSVAKNILNAPGFRGSRIDWHILKPWLEEHKEELNLYSNQSLAEVKRQNAIKDGILKDLDIAERKAEILRPDEVISFLQSMGNAQSIILNTKEKEIRAKVDEATAKLVSKAFDEIRQIFKSGSILWIQEHKLNS